MLQRPLEPAQYTAIRYAERLADAGAIASIGTVGDSFDNALAETVIGLYKTECVKIDGPSAPSTNSNWPPCHGSTGSTTTGCTPHWTTSHHLKSSRSTTVKTPPRRTRARENSPSTKPGAVHCP